MLTPINKNSLLSSIEASNLNFEAQKGSYNAEIRRDQPTAILLLIDQSGSMSTDQNASKCAVAINKLLNEIVNICTREDGIRSYLEVSLITYGSKSEAHFLFTKHFMTLSELKDKSIGTETIKHIKKIRGVDIEEEKQISKWVEAVADGNTPMGDAFDMGFDLLEKWIQKHPHSFPPVVINVSDGQATDCNESQMLEKALKIKNLATTDGNVLLFNCHLGAENGNKIIFPQERSKMGKDKHAKLMYDMSSYLPEKFYNKACQAASEDLDPNKQIVAVGYNCKAEDFTTILEVGTQTQTTMIINNV